MVDWAGARAALAESTDQLTRLLRSVDDPDRPALGVWTVAEVGTHLTHAFDIVSGLALQEQSSFLDDLAGLAAATTARVDRDPERDLGVLAEHIEAGARRFLDQTGTAGADDSRPWLVKGSTTRLVTLTCHLLNEVLVHGYDVARASHRPWPIQPAAAAMVLEGFLFQVLPLVDPGALVHPERAAGVQAAFEIRIRGGGRVWMVFDNGRLSVPVTAPGRIDCRLSVEPAAFLLVAWGRRSQWGPIMRGQLLAWGRRPWLGVRLRGLVRNP